MDRQDSYSTNSTRGCKMKKNKFSHIGKALTFTKKGIKSMKTSSIALTIAILLGSIIPNQVNAQINEELNSIEAIETVEAGGNSQNTLIQIKLKAKLEVIPNSSVTSNPNRLIIDLPQTLNETKDLFTYNHDVVKDVKITTIDNKSRLIFNLNKNVKHNISLNGELLTIRLENIEKSLDAANSKASGSMNKELKDISAGNGVKGIDFQRNNEGGGKIIINLASRDTLVDVKQIGASLAADFINAKSPDNIKRNYDVNDFATPVKNMRLTAYNNGTRLLIEPKGAWRYSSYQANDQFVIEVNPVKADTKAAQQAKYIGKKLSLNFQDIDVRSLMQVFADFTNINIVVNDNVQGNLTLRLKDVPWDQAFDIVLQTKNLGSKRNGNIIWVAPKDEMLAKEKQELEGKAQIADLEPVRAQTIQLQYHKAEVVAKGLLGEGESAKNKPIISKRGSVIFDARTNQLFISDIPSKLEEINQLVQKIDVPIRQVVIEARIVEANDTFGRNLGVKLGFVDLRKPFSVDANGNYTTNSGLGIGGSRLGISANQTGALQTFGAVASQNQGVRYDIPNTNFFSLPAGSINGFTPSSLGFSLFSSGAQTLLNLELSALEADGKGKIVSSPRILTTDKQKALIEQGTELPYESATSSGATSVQFKKANLKLEVTPQITPEGKVFLDVDINKDSPSAITNGSAGLAIDTKHVQTQVLVDNGGTVMIGGIFQETERKNVTQVPFLGSLPIIGNLFKTTSRNKERNEILIFLTPKVIEVSTTAKPQ